jgi:hypothetical protein
VDVSTERFRSVGLCWQCEAQIMFLKEYQVQLCIPVVSSGVLRPHTDSESS